MMKRVLFLSVAISSSLSLTLLAAPAGTFPVDPVELVRGREVPGDPQITTDHYRFRYQFASEENREEFLRSPSLYEIQLGGACGRMGPLSGTGRPDIYAVHKNRIYIFASVSCKETFEKDPISVLDSPDPKPEGSTEAKKKGRELIERVVAAMGGENAIDQAKNYQVQLEQTVESAGRKYENKETLTIAYPDRVRSDSQWNESRYSLVLVDDEAWSESANDMYMLHPQQRDAMRRQYLGHDLLAILKARKDPGFAAVHQGHAEVPRDGKPATTERVAVHVNGVTNILAVEPETGRILAQAFRGQGPQMTYGTVQKYYADYAPHGDLVVPQRIVTEFAGQEVAPKARVTVRVNSELDAGTFKPAVPE